MELSLRRAADSDLQAIIRLWLQNIKTANTGADIADLFRESNSYFFVAVSTLADVDERIIGFIGGAIRMGHGHISGIAVDKAYRRSTVGEKLIKSLEHKFRTETFDTVTLEVRKSNTIARRFYEKQNYHPAYVVKEYYADGEDAVVYAKKI